MLPGDFPSFETPVPESAQEWEDGKEALRGKLAGLLGEWPEMFTPKPEVVSREEREGFVLEKFSFENGAGYTVPGYLLLPEGAAAPGRAILYQHYHGEKYWQGKEEVVSDAHAKEGSHGLVAGEELARAGYVVMCIDAYAFGERRWQGPAGEREEGRETEESLAKMFLWEGRTLWGMMVRDDVLALNYLLSRPEVDAARVGAMGMSMGSTRSWWLAALDERVKCVAGAACLTRYQDLVARGELRAHGWYYFVPGMLREGIDMEAVTALVAPRAMLTLTGDADAGSPVEGVEKINGFLRELYGVYGASENFRGVVYPGVGHVFSKEMWGETVAWLAGKL